MQNMGRKYVSEKVFFFQLLRKKRDEAWGVLKENQFTSMWKLNVRKKLYFLRCCLHSAPSGNQQVPTVDPRLAVKDGNLYSVGAACPWSENTKGRLLSSTVHWRTIYTQIFGHVITAYCKFNVKIFWAPKKYLIKFHLVNSPSRARWTTSYHARLIVERCNVGLRLWLSCAGFACSLRVQRYRKSKMLLHHHQVMNYTHYVCVNDEK